MSLSPHAGVKTVTMRRMRKDVVRNSDGLENSACKIPDLKFYLTVMKAGKASSQQLDEFNEDAHSYCTAM